MATKKEQALSLEQAMAELEALAQKMEQADTSLEQTVALYERGTQLCTQCRAQLDAFEGRLKVLKGEEEVPFEL